MKALKHDFKTPFGLVDVAGCNGYLKALNAILEYLKEETDFKPENRYIDGAKLLDAIKATSKELEYLNKI